MTLHTDVLRKEPGIPRLFELFRDKYRSLGYVGGTVSLAGFSDEELEAIAGLCGIPAEKLKGKGRIALSAFEKGLVNTVFAGGSFIGLLEDVLQEKILTKKEEDQLAREAEDAFFAGLLSAYPQLEWWWARIQAKAPDTRWVWSLYRQDKAGLMAACARIGEAFLALPDDGSYERLPLFAQRVTGNPHAFDDQAVDGKLLIHCLFTDQTRRGLYEGPLPRTTEAVNDMLGRYGLMRDDLWSFVTCRGLLAKTACGIHPVWEAAAQTDSVLNVPMKELAKLVEVRPAQGRKVWIVENSSVCSTLYDKVPSAPLICTHGQFRTASWLLLDLLANSGCTLYYSGDLDPEGLLMADRLKNRYRGQLVFWRMDESAYKASISEEDVSSRLAQLHSIRAPELIGVSTMIVARKKAGYQEGLIEQLVGDLRAENDDWIT